ncbi:MAG: metal-transporting ATPase, partial [Clostridia bacterium]|nr:metal-transporting ATPase [Clostridia bacterium]
AHVGIALGAGADIAIDSADIVLTGGDLLAVADSIRLSRACMRNIKENLFWAFFYNSVGIPIAAGALFLPFGIALSPMLGACAMSMSSFCVVCNALRLRRFKTILDKENKINNNKTERKEQTMKYQVTIEGMMCPKCEAHAKAALEGIGAKNLTVSHTEGKAEFTGCRISEEKIRNAVTNAGYEVKEIIKG